ncbi:MAG: hypothetical protein LC126_05985 [Bryobacterales bacterium]|nr:hypothetical protein [Bryobacterales bacterium]
MTSRVIVIGESALSVQCAQLLQRRNHNVAATCSPDGAPLKSWAEAASIPHFSNIGELANFACDRKPDYLFSIVNYRVLPLELLRIPRLPINYHDGPLPRYAGVYATSWAIINNEAQHGVTWHVMVDKVDAGDILTQRSVVLSENETVHSLNMKCHIAAYRAFSVLLSELESESVSRTPQNLHERTYYRRSKWKSTRISWNWTAREIDRFCRALAFHPGHNPIGEPIGVLNGVQVYVQTAIPCTGSGEPVGTIVDVAKDYVQVATAEDDVRLYNIRPLNGTELSLAALKAGGPSTAQ